MQKKDIIRIVILTLFLLLIPLVLTLINPNSEINGGKGGGWDWMPGDFVVMGALIFITGLAIVYAAKKIRKPAHRAIAIAAIVIGFLLIWVELAVDAVSQFLHFFKS